MVENQASGVRTYLTGYDPSGTLIEIASGDVERIVRLCFHLDELQSKYSEAGNAKKSLRQGGDAHKSQNLDACG